MKGLFSSKNKEINRPSFSQSDSFLVDLRSLVNDKKSSTPFIVKKNNDLAKKSKFQKKPNLSVATSFFKKTNDKKNYSLSSFYKGARSWHFSFDFLSSVNYSFWRRSRIFRHEVSVLKEARHYFHYLHRLSRRNLRFILASSLKEKKANKDKSLLNWYRSLFAFALILVFIILPFKLLAYFKIIDFPSLKDTVLVQSLSAFENLAAATEGASHLSWQEAIAHFNSASNSFGSAQNELSRVDDWLLPFASFAKDPELKMAAFSKKFLAAGVAASELGRHLSEAGAVFESREENKSWGDLIDSFVHHGNLALVNAKELQTNLDSIKADALPLKYQAQFISFRNQADSLTNSLETLLNSAQAIKLFLGVSSDKRYLLVFQNNAEIRGSGGFLGSYALVDIRDGMIRKLEVPSGGSYDTEAGMRSFIKSPEPLWLVNPRWYFWDANWWPDWPTTAKALMWFYEKSDGPTVDGVISFTPDVLEDLLRISGEIDLQEEYGLSVNADNFWELIQTIVEKPNLERSHPEAVAALPDSPINEPKKIIGDLMVKIMERLPQVLTSENMPALLAALEDNLAAKNILLYFSDSDLQSSLQNYGLDASLREAPHDYLMIAHTNIAGQKSDRRMSDRVEHETEVLNDGSIIDTLTIYRTHNGLKNEILSGVRNVDWLRVYVPQGSLLLAASGFRVPDANYFSLPESDWQDYSFIAETENIAFNHLESGTKMYKENGKTVFANWVMTDPGQTSVIRLKYRLPFKLQKNELSQDNWRDKLDLILAGERASYYPFSLLMQKQPGAKPLTVNLSLRLPSAWKIIWSYSDKLIWNDEFNLERDSLKAVLLEN